MTVCITIDIVSDGQHEGLVVKCQLLDGINTVSVIQKGHKSVQKKGMNSGVLLSECQKCQVQVC